MRWIWLCAAGATGLMLCGSAAFVCAQDPPPSSEAPPTTVLPHSESSRFWVSGQANIILQWHPGFPAKYAGMNSLQPAGENATSQVLTLFTGLKLTPTTEVLADVEMAAGRGLSSVQGVAGFPNLDVVRNPQLSKAPYLARFMLHQVLPLSSETVAAERGPLGLATALPRRRLEFRIGKFSLVDFFDLNSGGSDSHLQFTNWAVDNNGAYDYAANTRGYTWGAMVEYNDQHWALRFAEALMPKVANGIHLDADLSRAHSENIEAELRGNFLRGRAGAVRLLSYVNHANMGSYRQAVNAFLAGQTAVPDITAHPLQTTIKYGFGVNLEQGLTSWLTGFCRWGWNEGRHESFAYTEVDQTVLFGAGANGKPWRRKLDRAGVAFVSNGIAGDHQRYLALGGLGFLLGDGTITYRREEIVELYYTVHLWRGVFAAFDLQRITNPGYNRDRGPVLVPGVRLHLEF
ncbi:MAG TPA: carbohydrate porin [Candidatus Acidoferrales bacterium]|nr:carbohydrate porin [Candidatus Acidoferrales bacterium]